MMHLKKKMITYMYTIIYNVFNIYSHSSTYIKNIIILNNSNSLFLKYNDMVTYIFFFFLLLILIIFFFFMNEVLLLFFVPLLYIYNVDIYIYYL